MAQDSEASVEEILESIKKVIARDNREGALEARRRRVEEAEQADTQPVTAFTPQPAEDETEEHVLDLAEMEFVEDDEGEQEAETNLDAAADPQLTNDAVRGAMRENLEALAMLAEPGVPPQIVRSGETSLEGLTREMLRPMLAEWLDKNLPGIVEKLVQAEIARIAGKRG
ncbi:MAG: DUF2497 domain-containing protein [Pseudomonadota bacterium]